MSRVWQYFRKIRNESFAQCLICSKIISTKHASTSGLSRHLKYIHKICLNEQSEDPLSVTASSSNAEDQPPDRKIPKYELQTLIAESPQTESLEEIVSMLAVKDGLTIHQITRSDFIREAILQKGFHLPQNESEVTRLILLFYERKKKEIIASLDQIKQSDGSNPQSVRFSLCIDEWTSVKRRRYFNICVHATNGTVYNLGLVYISRKCGAKETKTIVEKRLQEFGLCFEKEIVAVTSDRQEVMDKFGRECPTEMVLCLNHAIHLSFIDTFCKRETNVGTDIVTGDQDVNPNSSNEESEDDTDCFDDNVLELCLTENVKYVEKIQQPLNETRALVTLFRKSPTKNITLQKYVQEEFGREIKLLLDSPSRWDTMIQMIERFLKLKNAVKKALMDLKMFQMWNDANINILQSLLNIFLPLKLSIEALSRRDATILTAEAIVKVLVIKLRTLESDLANQFVEYLIDKINERRNVNLVSLVKYIHNPFKYNDDNENIFPHCNKTALIKYTEELCARLYPSSSSFDSPEASNISNQYNEEQLQLDDGFDLKLQKAIEAAGTSEQILTSHVTRNVIKNEFQLFDCTGQRTPTIEKLYNAVLTVKPTSTKHEHVFLLPGNVKKIRSCLSDDTVNALVFLKSYFLGINH